MNNKNFENIKFIEEQLYEAKNALFTARTVKEVKFLQSKINYLKNKAKELQE
ncbi:MAG: hypothetical protein QMD12_01010 [Candidatus Aenigmarchaeota archaeon]|nr:hypothetical protein [Candidatus Aenigmarchaeota archaeon]